MTLTHEYPDATKAVDDRNEPVITGVFRIQVKIDAIVGRLWEEDRQLCHILTHSVLLIERPTDAKSRRAHAISRVLYTWLRREEEHAEEAAADIETLLPLGRTDRWKSAIRTWAFVTRTEPVMFLQHATYANYAAD